MQLPVFSTPVSQKHIPYVLEEEVDQGKWNRDDIPFLRRVLGTQDLQKFSSLDALGKAIKNEQNFDTGVHFRFSDSNAVGYSILYNDDMTTHSDSIRLLSAMGRIAAGQTSNNSYVPRSLSTLPVLKSEVVDVVASILPSFITFSSFIY